MAIEYDKLMSWPFEEIVHTYDWKDSALYALGLGFGADPLDRSQLRFVYEADQLAVPTMAVVLGTSGFWVMDPDTGVDWVRVLHGLCTLGVAGHALLKLCCDYDPARFRGLDLRFTAPVYPGETIRTEVWRDGSEVSFRSRAVERDVSVLDHGRAEVA